MYTNSSCLTVTGFHFGHPGFISRPWIGCLEWACLGSSLVPASRYFDQTVSPSSDCLDWYYLGAFLVRASRYLHQAVLLYDNVLHFSVSIMNLSWWENQEEWDGRCVWHIWGRGEAHTGFPWGNRGRERHGRQRRREVNRMPYMFRALDAYLVYLRATNCTFVTTKICYTVL
jgi:hypothetical protein